MFTKEHEWVEVDKDIATIGITDYAQVELGEIVHVDLPSIGTKYNIHETLVSFKIFSSKMFKMLIYFLLKYKSKILGSNRISKNCC